MIFSRGNRPLGVAVAGEPRITRMVGPRSPLRESRTLSSKVEDSISMISAGEVSESTRAERKADGIAHNSATARAATSAWTRRVGEAFARPACEIRERRGEVRITDPSYQNARPGRDKTVASGKSIDVLAPGRIGLCRFPALVRFHLLGFARCDPRFHLALGFARLGNLGPSSLGR